MSHELIPSKSQDIPSVYATEKFYTLRIPFFDYLIACRNYFWPLRNPADVSIIFESVAWHPQRSYLAARNSNNYICIYDVRNQKWSHEVHIDFESGNSRVSANNKIFSMKWMPNSDSLLVNTNVSVNIYTFDDISSSTSKLFLRSKSLPTSSIIALSEKEIHRINMYTILEVSPQGRLFATVRTYDNYVCIWDAGMMQYTPVYCLDGTRASMMKWSPSGAYLAVANTQGDIFLASCESWRHSHCLHVDGVRCIAWLGMSNRLLIFKENSTNVYICSVLDSSTSISSTVKIDVDIIPAPFRIVPPSSSSQLHQHYQQQQQQMNATTDAEVVDEDLFIDRVCVSKCGRFIAVSFYKTSAAGAAVTSTEAATTVAPKKNKENTNSSIQHTKTKDKASFVAVYSCYQQSPALLLNFTLLRLVTYMSTVHDLCC